MDARIAAWDADPIASFSLFVTTLDFVHTGARAADQTRIAPLGAKSVQVYQFMFGKFARWLASRDIPFSRASHYDVLMFLELGSVVGERQILDLNSKISYRYLRLIERCYLYLQIEPNPARHAIFGALKQQRYFQDKAMVALNGEEIERFVAALPYAIAPSQWRRRRDRALQLTMLFAGLRVAEVLGLQIDEISQQVELDGSHTIHLRPEHKHATSYQHSTLLRPPAVRDVLAWLEERRQLPLPGQLAFPSHSGKQLNATTVYLQVKATLAAAGIAIRRSGGRTLRNTYAVQEITQGTDKPALTEHLGLALERSTEPYLTTQRQQDSPDQH